MKIFPVLIILMVFSSCEKSQEDPELIPDINEITRIPGAPNTNFETHILEGYFIKSIAFDSKGNAWVGTFNQGLIRYNSSETIVYNSGNSSFPEDAIIWDVAVDYQDKVWIGSEGIIEFDGDRFKLHNTQNSPIPEDFVYSIAIDSKDNIWFTSCRFQQGGIVKHDGDSWEVFTPENSELPGNLVHSIAIDQDDKVWLALGEKVGNAYLAMIDGNQWNTYTSDDIGFEPYYLSQIAMNSHKEVCVAIDYSLSSSWYHSGPQVFVFNGNSSIQLKMDSTTSITAMTVDNEDNIWCITQQGFAVYNWDRWMRNDTIFRGHGAFEIVQSPDNTVWIGTGNGIYISE
jgi:ligand-binding sensor domain-containing protein